MLARLAVATNMNPRILTNLRQAILSLIKERGMSFLQSFSTLPRLTSGCPIGSVETAAEVGISEPQQVADTLSEFSTPAYSEVITSVGHRPCGLMVKTIIVYKFTLPTPRDN